MLDRTAIIGFAVGGAIVVGALGYAAAHPGGYAHHSYVPVSAVAAFYANGASQLGWTFTLTSGSPGSWTFRMARPPTCTGTLSVRDDPAGGTLTEADPDSA